MAAAAGALRRVDEEPTLADEIVDLVDLLEVGFGMPAYAAEEARSGAEALRAAGDGLAAGFVAGSMGDLEDLVMRTDLDADGFWAELKEMAVAGQGAAAALASAIGGDLSWLAAAEPSAGDKAELHASLTGLVASLSER